MRVIDPLTAPIPRYLDIYEALKLKAFEEPGSAFSAPLIAEIGNISHALERLQDDLADLYKILTSDTDNAAPFGSGFRKNLELCKRATDQRFVNDKPKAKALRKWFHLCQMAAQIRNKVVHGQVTNIHFVGKYGNTRGMFLTPSPTMLASRALPSLTQGPYCWNVEHLRHYVRVRTFVQLRGMIMTVREELEGGGDRPLPAVLDPARM